MSKIHHFDYAKYQLAVAIYEFAEVLVCRRDPLAQEYCQKRAAAALQTAREQSVNWRIVSGPARGKRNAGRVSVEVETHADTRFGHTHTPQIGSAIEAVLRQVWQEDIAGGKIEEILERAKEADGKNVETAL